MTDSDISTSVNLLTKPALIALINELISQVSATQQNDLHYKFRVCKTKVELIALYNDIVTEHPLHVCNIYMALFIFHKIRSNFLNRSHYFLTEHFRRR